MSFPRRLRAMTERPPGLGRAWFNVIFCGALCFGVPAVLFLQSRPVLLGTFLALGGLVGTIAMEVHFVRALRGAQAANPQI